MSRVSEPWSGPVLRRSAFGFDEIEGNVLAWGGGARRKKSLPSIRLDLRASSAGRSTPRTQKGVSDKKGCRLRGECNFSGIVNRYLYHQTPTRPRTILERSAYQLGVKTWFNTLAHLPLPFMTTTESGLGLTNSLARGTHFASIRLREIAKIETQLSLPLKPEASRSNNRDDRLRIPFIQSHRSDVLCYIWERRNNNSKAPRMSRRTVAADTFGENWRSREWKKQTGKETTRNSVHRATCVSEPDAPLTIVQFCGRYRPRNVAQRDSK